MEKTKESKRVGYVFSPDTVNKLKELCNLDAPIYSGRTATWMVEYAIHELHRRAVSDAADVALFEEMGLS